MNLKPGDKLTITFPGGGYRISSVLDIGEHQGVPAFSAKEHLPRTQWFTMSDGTPFDGFEGRVSVATAEEMAEIELLNTQFQSESAAIFRE